MSALRVNSGTGGRSGSKRPLCFLQELLQAANQMQPALDDFYASLTTEQKARFNTLQQVAGQ